MMEGRARALRERFTDLPLGASSAFMYATQLVVSTRIRERAPQGRLGCLVTMMRCLLSSP